MLPSQSAVCLEGPCRSQRKRAGAETEGAGGALAGASESTSVCRVGDGVGAGNRSRAAIQPQPFAAWETEATQRGPLGWPSVGYAVGGGGTASSAVAGGGVCLRAAQPRFGC